MEQIFRWKVAGLQVLLAKMTNAEKKKILFFPSEPFGFKKYIDLCRRLLRIDEPGFNKIFVPGNVTELLRVHSRSFVESPISAIERIIFNIVGKNGKQDQSFGGYIRFFVTKKAMIASDIRI